MSDDQILPFVITLEETSVGQLCQALERIGQKEFVLAEPLWLPIWRVLHVKAGRGPGCPQHVRKCAHAPWLTVLV